MATPDIFLSYNREDAERARLFAESFEAEGFDVWWDQHLRSGESYDRVTEDALRGARAVVVLWSRRSVDSHWVRAEATLAQRHKTLLPAMVEPCERPIMFELTQTADLTHWQGDTSDRAWLAFVEDVRKFTGRASPALAKAEAPAIKPGQISLVVLPFANMSRDEEQEYFSDGITEDIITDLSQVSALRVVSRNSAFTFKEKHVDIPDVARQLGVSHVLEGSVRKAGNRVRVTAQLIDGATNDHVWAQRYDRDLDDIFELQDELSQAIVKALKVKLLPEEKKVIARRGTENVEAYNLYLMARQEYASGSFGLRQAYEAIIRICRRATEIDPEYADAWALMAEAQSAMHARLLESSEDDGLVAAERALKLNPDLAEARAVKAQVLFNQGRTDEANREIEIALRLDPESWAVNRSAASMRITRGHLEEATALFEKAAALEESDFSSPGMLITCYRAIGDGELLKRAVEMTLNRCEKALARDRNNGSAMAMGASALTELGERDRAQEWMNRSLLVDPDNILMRYNFACALAANPEDRDATIEMLAPAIAKMAMGFFSHTKMDPDLDPIREDPRFKAMMAEAETRLMPEKRA